MSAQLRVALGNTLLSLSWDLIRIVLDYARGCSVPTEHAQPQRMFVLGSKTMQGVCIGLSFRADGDIWAFDKRQLVVFGPLGAFVRRRVMLDNRFFWPNVGVAFGDTDDQVYVLDALHGDCRVHDAHSGALVRRFSAYQPTRYYCHWYRHTQRNGYGIALDNKRGQVYVADKFNSRVVAMDRHGRSLWCLGGLNLPCGVAVGPTGEIWLVDVGSRCVRALDGHGRQLSHCQFGCASTYAHSHHDLPHFAHPISIALDQAGHVYVCDRDKHHIQVCTRHGVLITTMGGQGTRAGQFEQPMTVNVDSEDRIYVCDSTKRVQCFAFVC